MGLSTHHHRSQRGGAAWTPASLGTSLKGWWKSDAGVKGRTAAQFTAANSEFLSKTVPTTLDVGDVDWWYCGRIYMDTWDTNRFVSAIQNGTNQLFWLYESGTKLTFNVYNGVSTLVGTAQSAALSTGTWYYFMAYHSATSNEVGISINGAAFTTAATTGAAGASGAPFQIGSRSASPIYFDGRMQTFAFGAAGSDSMATIRDLFYNSGNGKVYADLTSAQKTSTGLISMWNLTEESGARADSHGANALTDNNTVTANDGKVEYAVTADASVVYKWTDQSAGALLPVQATHTKKPLLKTNILNTTRSVLRFDGTDDFLKVASGAISNQPLWGWAVVDDNDAATRYYFDGGAASKVSLFHDGTNLNANAGSSVGAAHTAGAPHLVTFSVNGASSQIWVDGTSLATGDAGAQNQDSGIAIGADNAGATPLAGDIAEIAFVAGSPSAADLANLKAYINARYNLGVA